MQFLLMTPAEQCKFFFNDTGGEMPFFLTPAEQCNFSFNNASRAMQFFQSLFHQINVYERVLMKMIAKAYLNNSINEGVA